MADQPTTPTGLPPPKRYQVPTIPAFASWAEGRTGFTKAELAEIYATTFGLAPEALKGLEREIGTKATETLTPKPVAKPAVPPQVITRPAPDLLIARTPYPKWWKENLTAPINILGPATQVIAGGRADQRIWVATIALTVSGETEIQFTFGTMGLSGWMKFGATDEPRGMVIAMGNSPASCGMGGFSIYSSGDGISVGGFATFFVESTKETPE